MAADEHFLNNFIIETIEPGIQYFINISQLLYNFSILI